MKKTISAILALLILTIASVGLWGCSEETTETSLSREPHPLLGEWEGTLNYSLYRLNFRTDNTITFEWSQTNSLEFYWRTIDGVLFVYDTSEVTGIWGNSPDAYQVNGDELVVPGWQYPFLRESGSYGELVGTWQQQSGIWTHTLEFRANGLSVQTSTSPSETNTFYNLWRAEGGYLIATSWFLNGRFQVQGDALTWNTIWGMQIPQTFYRRTQS